MVNIVRGSRLLIAHLSAFLQRRRKCAKLEELRICFRMLYKVFLTEAPRG